MQQDRGFAGTLSASDHSDTLAAESIEVRMFRGVARKRCRQTLELRRLVRLLCKAHRNDDAPGMYRVAILQPKAKSSVSGLHELHLLMERSRQSSSR